MHLEILDSRRQKLFARLTFTAKLDLYLAGGTALAFHLGHRRSVDFDFYRVQKFARGELLESFAQELGQDEVEIVRNWDNTLEINIEDIHLSCFHYRYSLLEPTIDLQGVKIASVNDIAAMKMVALVQRAKVRDYIDIYYLIKKIGLPALLELAVNKYPRFNIYQALQALTYFTDVEEDIEAKRGLVIDPDFSWREAKKYLTEQAIKYQRQLLRD